VLFNGITLFVFLIIAFSIYSCNSDSTAPTQTGNAYDNNTINGNITFVDSLFTLTDTTSSGGYYAVSAFATWPSQPTQVAVINPVKVGNQWQANYKIIGLNNGSYTIAFAWIKKPYAGTYFLGVYDTLMSNDTLHNVQVLFGEHPKATISNNAGVGNFDFIAYLDTAKKIHKM
jgi:hypothetical protein